MKNSQKYKTAEERIRAFGSFCQGKMCDNCALHGKTFSFIYKCVIYWLDLEAEDEKPLPCPFCGSECGILERGMVYCMNRNNACGYKVWREGLSPKDMVKEHNRVAKAVMAAKKEVK